MKEKVRYKARKPSAAYVPAARRARSPRFGRRFGDSRRRDVATQQPRSLQLLQPRRPSSSPVVEDASCRVGRKAGKPRARRRSANEQHIGDLLHLCQLTIEPTRQWRLKPVVRPGRRRPGQFFARGLSEPPMDRASCHAEAPDCIESWYKEVLRFTIGSFGADASIDTIVLIEADWGVKGDERRIRARQVRADRRRRRLSGIPLSSTSRRGAEVEMPLPQTRQHGTGSSGIGTPTTPHQ